MTHTRNRKRRERSTVRVERLYPAMIEGRMAKGHRSFDGPEPWRPKLHGWRDIGYLSTEYGIPFDVAPYVEPAPLHGWSRTASDPLIDIAASAERLMSDAGYVATEEQKAFLRSTCSTEERLTLSVAPPALYYAPPSLFVSPL